MERVIRIPPGTLTAQELALYELHRQELVRRSSGGKRVTWRAEFLPFDPSLPSVERVDGVLRYRLHLHQLAALDLTKSHSIVVVSGGVRNGKTRWAGAATVNVIVNRPAPPPHVPRIHWIIVPTLTPYWDNIRPEIEYILGRVEDGGLILEAHASADPPWYKVRSNDGGAPWEIVVMSAEDPDRLRGASIASAHITEAGKAHEDALDNTLDRLVSSGGPLFVESSPWGLDWVWRRLLERATTQIDFRSGKPEVTTRSDGDKRVGAVRGVPIEANKALSPERVAALRGEASSERARKEYDGEHFAASGLIWSAFHPIRHVTNPVVPEMFQKGVGRWESIAGHDFGFGHPEAHVFVMTDGWRYWVVDEYREPERTFRLHADSIKSSAWARYVSWTYADPAGQQAQAEYQDYGIPMNDGANDVELGINRVAQLFESGRLKIASNCKKLIDEIGRWMRNEKTGKPVKIGEDLCDALRYAIYSHSLANDGKPNPYGTQIPGRSGRMIISDGEKEILDGSSRMGDSSEYLNPDGSVKEVV